jgi:hypothetical protein
MGVQCTVLGHAYGGTESEQHREDREDGTVLISREYQVCTRCGNRKELYRNEQLLPNGDRATDTSADGANSESQNTQTAVEPPAEETPAASAGGTALSSTDAVEETPNPAPAPADGETGGVILEADDNGGPSGRGPAGDTEPSVDTEPTHGERGERADDAQPSDPTARAGPDGREFGEWPQDATADLTGSDHQATSGAVTDEASGTDDAVGLSGAFESSSQAETDDSAQRSARSETADGWATSTEPAGTASTKTEQTLRGASETVDGLSAFGTDDPSDPEIRCHSCESGWARAETSLREGDLCPDCREGYVAVR